MLRAQAFEGLFTLVPILLVAVVSIVLRARSAKKRKQREEAAQAEGTQRFPAVETCHTPAAGTEGHQDGTLSLAARNLGCRFHAPRAPHSVAAAQSSSAAPGQLRLSAAVASGRGRGIRSSCGSIRRCAVPATGR